MGLQYEGRDEESSTEGVAAKYRLHRRETSV
jgi:hypothetical protein